MEVHVVCTDGLNRTRIWKFLIIIIIIPVVYTDGLELHLFGNDGEAYLRVRIRVKVRVRARVRVRVRVKVRVRSIPWVTTGKLTKPPSRFFAIDNQTFRRESSRAKFEKSVTLLLTSPTAIHWQNAVTTKFDSSRFRAAVNVPAEAIWRGVRRLCQSGRSDCAVTMSQMRWLKIVSGLVLGLGLGLGLGLAVTMLQMRCRNIRVREERINLKVIMIGASKSPRTPGRQGA